MQFLRLFFIVLIAFEWLIGQERLNLPRFPVEIPLDTTGAYSLRRDFTKSTADLSEKIPENIQTVLQSALPPTFQQGCASMVSSWGEIARGTQRLSFHHLATLQDASTQSSLVVLTLRCMSLAPGYFDEYFDELLATLILGDNRLFLQIIATNEDCRNCSNLTRLEFHNTFAVEGHPAFGIVTHSSTNNPCCDGPHSERRTTIDLFWFDGTRIQRAGSILQHETIFDHSDGEEGDFESEYQAKIVFEQNQATGPPEIVSSFVRSENKKERERGKIRYIWNAAIKSFEVKK